MDSCNADIIKMLNAVAHHLCRHQGFFGDWDVAGSSRDNRNRALAVFFLVTLQHDRTREFAIFHATDFLLHRGKLWLISACRENVAVLFSQPGEDLRYLRWCLALSENYFGHSRAQCAMMIDFGKSQIFKRQVS